ncbi:MAG TPA: 2-oxoglutarate and iron-dependent oxygenase domain-containing protein [Amycolatopsis sp.]|nr:2-oxoglutarate and iron-dependent oxygenase domain-containing protein [Amycolatopsis sp.]
MREATAAFFALPVEEKLRSAPADRASDRGYTAEGTEGLAYSLGETTPPDLSESFVIGAEKIDGEDPYGFFAPTSGLSCRSPFNRPLPNTKPKRIASHACCWRSSGWPSGSPTASGTTSSPPKARWW